MITLSPKQRRELRAQAHALHPVVSIGQHGLTPQVMHEIDIALKAHGLVKVRAFSEDRAEREAMLSQIADALEAAAVQHLGKVLILWRPLEAVPAKAPQRRAKKAGKRRTSAKGKAPRERVAPRERDVESKRRPPAVAKRTEGLGSDSPDARRRRRRTTSDVATSRSSNASTRRKPEIVQEDTRAPRGKSAPNPRRRRTS
jgi:RNA-binding protein